MKKLPKLINLVNRMAWNGVRTVKLLKDLEKRISALEAKDGGQS